MSATSLIQTDRPARFAGLLLASGVGLGPFAPARPAPTGPVLRLVGIPRDGVRIAGRREAAA